MEADYFVLIGVLVILVGFIFRLDTLAVVVLAGIITGLVAKNLTFTTTLETLGKAFVDKRYMSLFLLAIPVIGLLERHGLREKAQSLMARMKGASPGLVIIVYTFVRELAAALSLRLGGHVQFIRPLVNPMAQSAAENKYGVLDETGEDLIKGHCAAAENYGNFFGQNVFVASAGVLLIVSSLSDKDVKVLPIDVAKWSIPVAVIAFALALVQNLHLDRRIAARARRESISKGNHDG